MFASFMFWLHIFDFLGTFAFAAYGAYLAQRKGFDVFGILVCALVNAFAGGTVREILLNHTPVYLSHSWYLVPVLLGTIFSIALFHRFGSLQRIMLSVDALGLVTFAFLGATSALQAGLGFVGTILFATLSAVGGGVCCDLLVQDVPRIFYRDFYATPAILVGIVVFLMRAQIGNSWLIYSLLFLIFCLRLIGIKYRFQLWRRPVQDKKSP